MPTNLDPLSAIGPSLFLVVLSYLPFPSILAVEQVSAAWKGCCHTYSRLIWHRLFELRGFKLQKSRSLNAVQGGAGAMTGSTGGNHPCPSSGQGIQYPIDHDFEPPMDWKRIFKAHVELERNWKQGRCRAKGVTVPGDAVWKFQVDEEEGILISSSRMGECAAHRLELRY
jgi:hypothetical protein